jgi:hypothetical protein
MKKVLLVSVLISWLPYLFLATSVDRLETGQRAFNCTIKSAGKISQFVSLGAVYYSPLKDRAFSKGGYVILPYFFKKEDFFYAQCGDEKIALYSMSFLKIDEKIHVNTRPAVARLFGYELFREEDVDGFGTGWEGKKEGETVLVRLVDDKEVRFFHGKPIKGD